MQKRLPPSGHRRDIEFLDRIVRAWEDGKETEEWDPGITDSMGMALFIDYPVARGYRVNAIVSESSDHRTREAQWYETPAKARAEWDRLVEENDRSYAARNRPPMTE